MGSACSKLGAHSGGHTVLGSATSNENPSRGRNAATNPSSPGSANSSLAAEAAERRLQAELKRGTNAANPNKGKLASQAAKSNKSPAVPAEPDGLVWD